MFIGTRARIMAAAAMLGSLMGFESRRPLGAPHRAYNPPQPARDALARTLGRAPRLGFHTPPVRTRPRWGGETGRRFRQITAGTYTASNGLVGPGGVKVNSHGVLA